MTPSDVAALRARYESLSKDTVDFAFDGVHPDFELKTVSRVPNAGTYRGAEAAARFFADLVEPFDEVSYDVEQAFARDEQVVLFLLVRLKHHGSSAMVENHIGALWTVRDGTPVRCEMFAKRELALDAAGMTADDEVRD